MPTAREGSFPWLMEHEGNDQTGAKHRASQVRCKQNTETAEHFIAKYDLGVRKAGVADWKTNRSPRR